MKLFYFLIFFLLTLIIANAQIISEQELKDLKIIQAVTNDKPEISVNKDIIPALQSERLPVKNSYRETLLSNFDTLTNYFDRSSGLTIYTYQIQNLYLPVIGYNTLYHFIGVKYKTQSAVKVTELLVAYGAKILLNNYDSLFILLCRGNESNGLPSEVLNTSKFTLEHVDTSLSTPVFSAIKLQVEQVLSDNWVILLQTRRGDPNEDDFNAIFSNLQGDGRKENTACFGIVQNQQLLSNNLNMLPLNIQGDSLDFDVMILPVVDLDLSGIGDGININGVKIDEIYPNPTKDNIKISFYIEHPTSLRFDLIGLNGTAVKSLSTDNLNSGWHSTDFDVSDIAAGNYYLGIFSNKTKFAFKVKIVR